MTTPYACGRDTPWSYSEAVAALRSALTFGVNPSLDGITALCEALGRPQDSMAVVQVAGTNGKTSTARFVQALLRAEGVATALYTSPELERYPERMEIGGEVVTDAEFARAIGVAVDTSAALHGTGHGDPGPVTEFELLTAAALWLFRDAGVEIAVLEAGLGGRWDATSVAAPSVSVITGVGLDHTRILGDTLLEIAAEKAAIIRPGSAPVLGPGTAIAEDVFLARSEEVSTHPRAVRAAEEPSPAPEDLTIRYRVSATPHGIADALSLDIVGVHASYPGVAATLPSYQAANVATAVAAAEAALGRALDPDLVCSAVRDTRIPGRFEVLSAYPPVIIDAAHNPQAAAVLAASVEDVFPDASKRPALILGVLADKDAEGIVRVLGALFDRIIVTASSSPRAMAPATLADVVRSVTGGSAEVTQTVAEAVDRALVTGGGVLATGSITVAGEARSHFTSR